MFGSGLSVSLILIVPLPPKSVKRYLRVVTKNAFFNVVIYMDTT